MIKREEHLMHEHERDDISPKTNIIIWLSVILLVVFIWMVFFLGKIYFQYEVERERRVKISLVESEELLTLRKHESAVLQGKKGVLEDGKNISIKNAIDLMVKQFD